MTLINPADAKLHYTIIPDIHGRQFWRDAVLDVETIPVVFLGDYLDPYPEDMVKWSDAWKGLNDIVVLKKRFPDQVTLLLGNHDVHYLPGYPYYATSTRYNHDRAVLIRDFFMRNLDLFDIAKVIPRKNSRYPFLLTHAGIRRSWITEMARIAHPESPAVLDFILDCSVRIDISMKVNPVSHSSLPITVLHRKNEPEVAHRSGRKDIPVPDSPFLF